MGRITSLRARHRYQRVQRVWCQREILSSNLKHGFQIYPHLLSHHAVESVQRTKVGYVPRGLVDDATPLPGCA